MTKTDVYGHKISVITSLHGNIAGSVHWLIPVNANLVKITVMYAWLLVRCLHALVLLDIPNSAC